MILPLTKFQDACKKILAAVDTTATTLTSETLELLTEGDKLLLNVTNKEYYVRVIIELAQEEDLHAVVDAKLFLNLISKLTTNDVELSLKDNSLVVKGNGTYKFPLIYDLDELIKLPLITMNKENVKMNVSTTILNSIATYNSRQLGLSGAVKPVQSMYYVDENGCLTFTGGATTNDFKLEKPIKVLLSQKLVKLFRLFNSDSVELTLGVNIIQASTQQVIELKSDNVIISSYLCDNSLIASVPAEKIRELANKDYANQVVLNINDLQQTISRLMLFSSVNKSSAVKPYANFEFTQDGVIISDIKDNNSERISYVGEAKISEGGYKTILLLSDIKTVLDGCNETHITLNFGENQKAVVISRVVNDNMIRNVLQTCVLA